MSDPGDVLAGMATFDFLVAGVLVPLGGWLALVRAPADIANTYFIATKN